MRSLVHLLLLTSAILAPATVAAQSVSRADIDGPFMDLDNAIAQEARALHVRDDAQQLVMAREAGLRTAAEDETASRRSQIDKIANEDRAILLLLDQIEGLNVRPRKLLIEQAIVQDWYDFLQPAVANLTDNSFRGVEAEL